VSNGASSGEYVITYTVEGYVGTITLNRPKNMNTFNAELHKKFMTTIVEADRDDASRVLILRGAGDKYFCGGPDMEEETGSPGSHRANARDAVVSPGRDLVDTMVRMEKPLIAMVNGDAFSVGATIAMLSDIVVMDEEARIGDTHVRTGLVAGDGGSVVWPLLIGATRAKELLMTSRLITGAEAARIGLVAHAVPASELQATVDKLAQELVALPPYAVQATKASVNKIIQFVSDLVLDASFGYEHLSMHSADRAEYLRAWAAGEIPDFRVR
jgi:enoyl-CoA hydratase